LTQEIPQQLKAKAQPRRGQKSNDLEQLQGSVFPPLQRRSLMA